MCLHPSVSLKNEKICFEISEDKISVCEKTAGLRCGKFSGLNSACSKVYYNKNIKFLRYFVLLIDYSSILYSKKYSIQLITHIYLSDLKL